MSLATFLALPVPPQGAVLASYILATYPVSRHTSLRPLTRSSVSGPVGRNLGLSRVGHVRPCCTIDSAPLVDAGAETLSPDLNDSSPRHRAGDTLDPTRWQRLCDCSLDV